MARHPGISPLVTFCVWPIVLAVLMPSNCLPQFHAYQPLVPSPASSWGFYQTCLLLYLYWNYYSDKPLRIYCPWSIQHKPHILLTFCTPKMLISKPLQPLAPVATTLDFIFTWIFFSSESVGMVIPFSLWFSISYFLMALEAADVMGK